MSETEAQIQPGRNALAAGGVAALLASSCCLGPLVLVALGFSGAWIGVLTVMEPFRPYFISLAVIALAFAYHGIFQARPCKPGDACAAPRFQLSYRILFWIVAMLVLIALVFPYLAPLFY